MMQNFFDQFKTGNFSYFSIILLVILSFVALLVAYRIGRFLLKIFCILIGLAVIVAAVSWFLLQR